MASLHEVQLKEIADISIGMNVPKALINGQVKWTTCSSDLLGWVVNGPLNTGSAMEKHRIVSATVS